MMDGGLLLDKPVGITSNRALQEARKLLGAQKAGHAGTLDPLASGVLVVCVGQGTRLIEYVQRLPKTYEAVFLLGRTSDTEDVEGTVTPLDAPPIPTQAAIVNAAAKLTGTILQRPPAFSALKVAGRRAYDLARAGREVDLAPRPVEIYGIEVLGYVKGQMPGLRAIMLSNHVTPQHIRASTQAGAQYFLDKSEDFERIGDVLRKLQDETGAA